MHTGAAGLKHRKLVGKDGLRVDHIHLSGCLGWTMDQIIVIVSRISSQPLPLCLPYYPTAKDTSKRINPHSQTRDYHTLVT